MLRIMLVDSNVLFREGLSNLLQREPGLAIIAEAGTICEAVEQLRSAAPDVALVDAELPDIDEFNGIRLLLNHRPQMQVILLGGRNSEQSLLEAVRRGARGFLPKNNSLSKFMASMRAIERGEVVIPRSMIGCLLDEVTRMGGPDAEEDLKLLTARELDVLTELGRGRSNRQIATDLAIAENTVKVHVHNILEKLNLRNRRQAAHFIHGRK